MISSLMIPRDYNHYHFISYIMYILHIHYHFMFVLHYKTFDIIITDLSSVAGKLCHLIGSWLGLFLQSTSILRGGRSCSTRLSSLWSLSSPLSSPPWTSLSITSFSKKDVVGRLVIQDFWQTRERDFFFLPTGVYRFGRLYVPIQNCIWNIWRTYFQWFTPPQTITGWRKF